MARVTIQQNNFTAGEITPKMYGRTDISRYQAGAKTLTNGLPQLHGGISRRPGSVHVAMAKDTGNFRLLRFVYNRDQAYVIEMGAGYFRFFTESGQILNSLGNILEVSNSYAQNDLADITYTQNGNVLYLCHRNHRPKQLTRISNSVWTFTDIKFVNEPVIDDVFISKYKLVLGSTAVATGVSAQSSAFTAGMFRIDSTGANQSRKIYSSGGGEAIVTAIPAAPNNNCQVTVQILKAFESTTIDPFNWWIDGQPQLSLAITGATAVNSIITSMYNADLTASPVTTACTITSSTDDTRYGKRVANITVSGSTDAQYLGCKLKVTTSSGTYLYFQPFDNYNGGLSFYVYLQDDVTASQLFGLAGITWITKPYAASDSTISHPDYIGSIVSANGGLIRVTDITDTGRMTGVVVKALNSLTTVIPDAWAIQQSAWSSASGYPGSVTTYQQRLIFAGSTSYPNTMWLSRIGNYYDFLAGTLDDDALSINIVGEEQAYIQHVAQTSAIYAMCSSGEYIIEGGVEKPITPTNLQVRNQSVYGCNSVKPQRVGNELYFMQRAGRKLRAIAYREYAENQQTPDLSIMSEHLTDSGVVDASYQAEPESVLWLCMANGDMASVTIDREQDVISWARHQTDGDYFAACSIPSASSDVLFVGVMRDGTRRIEKMSQSVYLDAALVGTSGSPTNVWSGLTHLNGKTVQVYADGRVLPDAVVSGGSVTLDRNVSSVQIGLGYTTTITPVTPDVNTQTGASVGNSQRVSEVSLRVKDTIGCKVNGDYITFTDWDASNFDSAPSSFSGIKRIELLGWKKGEDLDITITQDQPLPFVLLSVIYKYQSND